MRTFKCINFKRNYDCINVKFIQANHDMDKNVWIECDEQELIDSDCTELTTVEGQGLIEKMFGYI